MNSKLQNASLEQLQAISLWNKLTNTINIKYSYPNIIKKVKGF